MCACGRIRQSRGPDERAVLTTFGPITITRRHFGCPDCRNANYIADSVLGIDGYLSPRVLLDADCGPCRDVTEVFTWPEYQEKSAVFWPDYACWRLKRDVWEIFDIPDVTARWETETAFESGQYLINKTRCWRELRMALWYAEHSDFVFKVVYGDKECFHLGWRKLGRDYAMPPKAPGWNQHTIVQWDFHGEQMFNHRFVGERIVASVSAAEFPLVLTALCFEFMDELRKVWDDVLWHNLAPTSEEQTVIDELTGQRFLYRRVGYDERPMRLEPVAKVGEGAAECERRWDVNIDAVLTLSRIDRPTCHLKRSADGVWRGAWLEHERMPIEFIPWSPDHAVVFARSVEPRRLGRSQPQEGRRRLFRREPLTREALGRLPRVRRCPRPDARPTLRTRWLLGHVAIARYLQPDMRCVDVGANYGYYTLLMAAACGPQGRVAACEPNPLLAGTYLPLNGFYHGVKIYPKVIGNRDDASVDFVLHDGDFATSSLERWAYAHWAETVHVPAITLDRLCADWPRLDLVKIDAEGAESLVWDGMQETLRCFPQVAVVMELHLQRDTPQTVGFLHEIERAGYVLRCINYEGEIVPTDSAAIFAQLQEHWTLWLQR